MEKIFEVKKLKDNLYRLAKQKEMLDKELKFRAMEVEFIEKYLTKMDYSKEINLDAIGEEYLKIRRECEAFGKLKTVKTIIAKGKMELVSVKKALRNPNAK